MTSSSISVNALARSRSFGMVDVEDVLFAFIGNRCGVRLAKFPRN
jgi:hypothetical protein